MSTLGKVLAVFNVLVAVLFLVFAGMDYGKQQTWSFEFRHRVAVNGLPVNNDDIDENEPNKDYPIVERLTPGVVKDIFSGNDGDTKDLGDVNGVKTLFEEVDRVRAKVNANVNAEPDAQKKKQLLKIYLVGLAKTLGEHGTPGHR